MPVKDRKHLEALCKKLHGLKLTHKLDAIAKNPDFPPYKIGRPPGDAILQRTPTPKIFRVLYLNDTQPRYTFRITLCGEKTYLVYSDYEMAKYALAKYKQAIPKGYNQEINTLAKIIEEKIKCTIR
jgi:hypothetical protein